ALSILKGAVPDRTRGFGHTAPTYVSRFPGSNIPRPGRHLISSGDPVADPKIEAEKAALRLRAHATRAAILNSTRSASARAVADNFFKYVQLKPSDVVAGYW